MKITDINEQKYIDYLYLIKQYRNISLRTFVQTLNILPILDDVFMIQ
jgi:hypothetical protein